MTFTISLLIQTDWIVLSNTHDDVVARHCKGYLAEDQASNDEVGRGSAFDVHWDQPYWLCKLDSHLLHLTIYQDSQICLHCTCAR